MRLTVTEEAPKSYLHASSRGSVVSSTSPLAASLAASLEEESDEELLVEALGNDAFITSPTMSIAGEPSPSIAQTTKTRSSEQVCSNEGEIVRAIAIAVRKWGVKIRVTP
jgi:hypothetical protein